MPGRREIKYIRGSDRQPNTREVSRDRMGHCLDAERVTTNKHSGTTLNHVG